MSFLQSEVGASGDIAFFATSSVPAGWLVCNGQAVSRATYSTLFAAIGTTFGVGDGSTTFTLPNLSGTFLRSWAAGGGTIDTARTFGTFQDQAITYHAHDFNVNRNLLYKGGNGWGNVDAPSPSAYDGTGSTDRSSVPVIGNVATETRPRNIALLVCIKS